MNKEKANKNTCAKVLRQKSCDTRIVGDNYVILHTYHAVLTNMVLILMVITVIVIIIIIIAITTTILIIKIRILMMVIYIFVIVNNS